MIYCKPPPSISTYLQGFSPIEVVDSLMAAHTTIHFTLERLLLKAQTTMKHSVDAHDRDVSYNAGD